MMAILDDIERLKKIIPMNNKNSDFELGIKIENKTIKSNNLKKVLKNLFLIYSEKNYNFIHSEFYNELQNVMNSINIDKNDMSSPSSAFESKDKININLNKKNKNEKPKVNINKPFLVINELDNFINETFKVIDQDNEMPEFKLSLQTLRENLLGR